MEMYFCFLKRKRPSVLKLAVLLPFTILGMSWSLSQTPVQPGTAGKRPAQLQQRALAKPVSATPQDQRLKRVFVRIPSGEFDMGCSTGDNQCTDSEKPRHHVRITKEFEIQKYPVTQALWKSVMRINPSGFEEGPDRPVENVSWDDVHLFLEKLDAQHDGFHYRLPTEAEWEYAARAGSAGPYFGRLDRHAWNNTRPTRGGFTMAVGQIERNAWGLYDMFGNTYEWVEDWYGEDYYQSPPAEDPMGPPSGTFRVLRGAPYNADASQARVSNRFRWRPEDNGVRVTGLACYISGSRCFASEPIHSASFGTIGFRCVREDAH
jgi:formylglycine-generating enzyme required for sulfatase activity